jgi:hypothetical protein
MQPTSSDGPSPLPPPLGTWSRQEWVAESAAARSSFLAVEIPRLCQAFEPLVLFFEGSALHGELCGILSPAGGRRYLSDLDLGVLTSRRVPPERGGEIARRIDTEISERIGDGPPPKIGFYCSDDRDRQDPTPGLVEAVRRPFVLWGDRQALGSFRVPEYERIPRWEAQRLLSNRAIEWLGARGDGEVASLYGAAKLMADCAAVALLSRGAYRGGGYVDRLEAALEMGELPEEEGKRMRGWTRWRIDPQWDTTPLGVGLADLDSSSLEEELRASILGSMRFAAATEEPGAFLGSHAVRGRSWARAWKRWARRAPGSLTRLRAALLTRTPRVLLFEAALCCAIGEDERAERIIWKLLGGAEAAAGGRASLGARIHEIGEMMSREGID